MRASKVLSGLYCSVCQGDYVDCRCPAEGGQDYVRYMNPPVQFQAQSKAPPVARVVNGAVFPGTPSVWRTR